MRSRARALCCQDARRCTRREAAVAYSSGPVFYRNCRASTRFVDDTSREEALMRDPGPHHEHDSSLAVARRAAGALEAEVLGILRAAHGPLSPGQVRERVSAGHPGGLSYS